VAVGDGASTRKKKPRVTESEIEHVVSMMQMVRSEHNARSCIRI
jgi:hypothetical protein